MKLTIKNMVCNHCIAAVTRTLDNLGVEIISVKLGRAEIKGDVDNPTLLKIGQALQDSGFELINDPAKDMVESIKREIIMMVRSDEPQTLKMSEFLSRRLNRDFRTLSRTFSESEGRTIENYLILQKTERVKELLLDGELTIAEIAYRTGYSSTAHLSRQFKSITTITPSEFREKGSRIPLNEV